MNLKRSGVIAHKIGMTQLFESNGNQVAVTMLKVSPNVVLGTRIFDKDGYTALQLGSCDIKLSKLTDPLKGFFEKIGQKPCRYIKEFRVDESNLLEVGHVIDASVFNEGQYIDVTGTSIGKGFAGVMKKYGYKGLRATHGVATCHRSGGSTGNRQDPGRVFKNKKMPGHMGAKRVTKLNLLIKKIDVENGLVLVEGAIPGHKNSLVYIRDAVKKNVVKS